MDEELRGRSDRAPTIDQNHRHYSQVAEGHPAAKRPGQSTAIRPDRDVQEEHGSSEDSLERVRYESDAGSLSNYIQQVNRKRESKVEIILKYKFFND